MRAGLTQEEAATTLGIPLKAWQRLETGRHNPTLETIGRVADALQVPVTEFFGAPLMPESGAAWLGLPAGWRWDASGVPAHVLLADRPEGVVVAAESTPGTGGRAPDRPLGFARTIGRRTHHGEGYVLAQASGSAPFRIEAGTWLLMRGPVEKPTPGSLVLMSVKEDPAAPTAPPWVLRRVGALDVPLEGGLRMRLDAPYPGGPSCWRAGADAAKAGVAAELVLVLGPSMAA
jgi:transcriptional regulator with XRE-family HTH domain